MFSLWERSLTTYYGSTKEHSARYLNRIALHKLHMLTATLTLLMSSLTHKPNSGNSACYPESLLILPSLLWNRKAWVNSKLRCPVFKITWEWEIPSHLSFQPWAQVSYRLNPKHFVCCPSFIFWEIQVKESGPSVEVLRTQEVNGVCEFLGKLSQGHGDQSACFMQLLSYNSGEARWNECLGGSLCGCILGEALLTWQKELTDPE